MEKSGFQKYCAEFIGTIVLVFMGCAAAVFLGVGGRSEHLVVALGFGLAVVAMAYTFGGVSGCHLNPAVSLAALLDKRIGVKDFVCYVIVQILGGIVGAALLVAVVNISGAYDFTGGFAANGVYHAGGIGGAFLVEVILTFIFVLVILTVTADPANGNIAGLIIGLTLTFVIIIGLPLTGVSVNPARSIGPAIFAGGQALTELWVFILAPLVGGVLSVCVYKLVCATKKA